MAATEEKKYVVLGGGVAAGYAAWEFQKRGGKKGELSIISEEPVVSYERPALSKAYLFPKDAARLPGFHTTVGGGGQKQEPSWYKENGIEFRTNTKVTAADIKGKIITTESGEKISYEKLIIALGSIAIDLHKDFKISGADLGNIFYLRDVREADAIVNGIAVAKKAGNKATVIGGGYIGLETAAALRLNGLDVTIVFPESRFMERLFTPEIADFYEKFYANKGIHIIKQDTATSFEGKDGKVTITVLKSGKKLESDIVVSGVGARPNTDLFKGQLDFLEEKPGGIKVNGKLLTSDPDVYAVGDIAAFPLSKYNTVTRQEHVANARSTAKHAISHILAPGETEDYYYLPYFYSREFNLSWQFYGINNDADETMFFGSTDLDKPHFGSYWIKDGKVVGAFLESGTPEENAALKKVAEQQPAAPKDLATQGLYFATSL
jgi:monodehydroascorbate reductase (NADH)